LNIVGDAGNLVHLTCGHRRVETNLVSANNGENGQ